MNWKTINEAQGLWDSLTKIYNLEGRLPDIKKELTDLSSADTSDLVFKNLGILTDPAGKTIAQQTFFNNVLIILITQTSSQDYETDKPEVDWEKYLEIKLMAQDLSNVLGQVSVISTISSEFNKVLMAVRLNIKFAKEQNMHYCTFGFGQLLRFGDKDNYLLVTDFENQDQEKIDKLFNVDFPYILTLNFLIKKDYENFLRFQKHLSEIQIQALQHYKEINELDHESDPIMLAIRKEHMDELIQDTQQIQSKILHSADRVNLNILKLNAAIRNIRCVKDEIFKENSNTISSFKEDIKQFLDTNVETLKKIDNMLQHYSEKIKNLIKDLEKREKDGVNEQAKPKIYTKTPTINESIPVEESPYKTIIKEYTSKLDGKSLESIPLEWCSSYIVWEPQPNRSLEIFHELVTGRGRFMGLCISKKGSEEIVGKYNLKGVDIYQISTNACESCIPPVLSRISHLINELLSSNIHSIIYLDGIDLLIDHNDFDRVLQFCNNIKESIVLEDSILILSLNDSMVHRNKLAHFMENSVDITNSEVLLEDLF